MSKPEDSTIVKSMDEKMHEATRLAFQCAYATTSNGNYRDEKDSDLITDNVWDWVDGLAQDSIMRKVDCRCSLKVSMEFDIGKCEEDIDNIIIEFTEILKKVGPPVETNKRKNNE